MAATDVDDETKAAELDVFVDRADQAGIDITVDAVTTKLEEHEIEVPSYSWVQPTDFVSSNYTDGVTPGRLRENYSTPQTSFLVHRDQSGNSRESLFELPTLTERRRQSSTRVG